MPPLPKKPDTVLDKLLHIRKVNIEMGYLYSMSDSSLVDIVEELIAVIPKSALRGVVDIPHKRKILFRNVVTFS